MDFKGCDRQFDWIEISLLYNQSDKHLTIYSSYSAECAARMIKKRAIKHIAKQSRNYSKLNITIELRNPFAKKMRLRVWGYTNGEYLYMMTDGSLTFKYKPYTIMSLDDAFEA